MAAEGRLHRGRVEALEDIADGGMRRCSAPVQAESRVQPAAVDVDEGDDAAIRVAAGHDGENGEQQHVGQLVELALRPARIRDVRQHIQQRRKHSHGNLPPSCCRKSQTLPGSGTPLAISRLLRPLYAAGRPQCSPFSSVEQPWPPPECKRSAQNSRLLVSHHCLKACTSMPVSQPCWPSTTEACAPAGCARCPASPAFSRPMSQSVSWDVGSWPASPSSTATPRPACSGAARGPGRKVLCIAIQGSFPCRPRRASCDARHLSQRQRQQPHDRGRTM